MAPPEHNSHGLHRSVGSERFQRNRRRSLFLPTRRLLRAEYYSGWGHTPAMVDVLEYVRLPATGLFWMGHAGSLALQRMKNFIDHSLGFDGAGKIRLTTYQENQRSPSFNYRTTAKVRYPPTSHTSGGRRGASPEDDGRSVTIRPQDSQGTGTNPGNCLKLGGRCFIRAEVRGCGDQMKVTLPVTQPSMPKSTVQSGEFTFRAR